MCNNDCQYAYCSQFIPLPPNPPPHFFLLSFLPHPLSLSSSLPPSPSFPSLTPSLPPISPSLSYLITHSVTQSLTQLLNHSVTQSLTDSITQSLPFPMNV